MTGDPFLHLLGVDESAGPAALLGLADDVRDRLAVETALRERLDRIFRHPDGRTAEAERVRAHLRRAAARLIGLHAAGAAPRRPARPPSAAAHLTEFDRYVLAILVGGGGWNAASRGRLVALAGAYGVTVDGLVKVIEGLSEYARRGGPRLGVEEITSGARLDAPAGTTPQPSADVEAEARLVADRMSDDPDTDSLWTTIKLSMIFGLVTLILGVVLLRTVLVDGTPEPPVAVAPLDTTDADGLDRPAPPLDTGPVPGRAPRLAKFRPLPTFLGNALPTEATDAADRCPVLPEELDLVTRKLSISDDASEAVFRSWEVCLDTIASGWVLVDESTSRVIDRGIVEVLREASDAPSTSDRLLEVLTPQRGSFRDPIDVWRGAWRAGTLGAIAGNPNLPPVIVERAQDELRLTLGDRVSALEPGFDAAADAWLALATEKLVEMLELDDRIYDYWEMWIAAQRHLGGADRVNVAVLSASESILATDTDLARAGPSVNVLGRLLLLADFESSRVVKDAVTRLFDETETIGDHDLWVLTSLLASLDAAPWFTEALVLPDDAGRPFRNRIRDRISRRWPALPATAAEPTRSAGRGITVDPVAAARWMSIVTLASEQPLWTDHEGLMIQLVLAARLNEVAALLAARQAGSAEGLMDTIEDALRQTTAAGYRNPWLGTTPGGQRMGRPMGRDGEWAAAFESTRRNSAEKMTLLRSLRTQAGSDLGPIDAEAFVLAVYRGSSQEVRSIARSVATEQFTGGANVIMEMLDQFPGAPRNPGVSETIQRMTGRLLPPTRNESWTSEARLSLVEHALALIEGDASLVDRHADVLRDSYAERLGLLRREPAGTTALSTTDEAAADLADGWHERAQTTIAVVPTPDDLAGLRRRRTTRRRLSEGPIQAMVAEQLAVLDALTYVTVAEQPAVRDAALEVLATAAEDRRARAHALQQAIDVERAVSRIWALRMNAGIGTQGEGDAP